MYYILTDLAITQLHNDGKDYIITNQNNHPRQFETKEDAQSIASELEKDDFFQNIRIEKDQNVHN